MKLIIPPKVVYILDVLRAGGYEAYAVGGCIRDTILGRKPNDWDITTSARPLQIKELFRRTVDTGLQHGTVTVLLGEEAFEVTTYRIDGDYQDHRHPEQVQFASLLSEDLMRRDFTINAMAYHPEKGLVDLFGGMDDLQKKVIRCVGNPKERFDEDALRIFRAVRFSAQLGFSIEKETFQALCRLVPTLAFVSQERIQVELVKLLLSDHPDYVQVLQETGILPLIIPGIVPPDRDRLAHLCFLPKEKSLRLAALLLPLGEKKAKEALRRMKFDNDTIKKTERLIRWYERDTGETTLQMRRSLYEIGDDLMEDLFLFQAFRRDVTRAREAYRQVLEAGECYKLSQLALTGSDLIAMGMKPGREIGQCLADCLMLVLEEPEKNQKELLENYVREKNL